MAEFIPDSRKLVVKLVYYGPALSGKTTNLMRLHDLLGAAHCGDLMTFATKGDRTLFFDLLPLMAHTESGYRVKFKLYTVPGQVNHDATRKAVLSRADGVVFVADSQNSQALSNFESFDNLEKNAGRVGLAFDRLPLVVQFNKRDLADIISEEAVLDRWQPVGLPVLFASALRGDGVLASFSRLLDGTYSYLDDRYALKRRYGIRRDHFRALLPDRVAR